MRELTANELEHVNGGLAPLAAWAACGAVVSGIAAAIAIYDYFSNGGGGSTPQRTPLPSGGPAAECHGDVSMEVNSDGSYTYECDV